MRDATTIERAVGNAQQLARLVGDHGDLFAAQPNPVTVTLDGDGQAPEATFTLLSVDEDVTADGTGVDYEITLHAPGRPIHLVVEVRDGGTLTRLCDPSAQTAYDRLPRGVIHRTVDCLAGVGSVLGHPELVRFRALGRKLHRVLYVLDLLVDDEDLLELVAGAADTPTAAALARDWTGSLAELADAADALARSG